MMLAFSQTCISNGLNIQKSINRGPTERELTLSACEHELQPVHITAYTHILELVQTEVQLGLDSRVHFSRGTNGAISWQIYPIQIMTVPITS